MINKHFSRELVFSIKLPLRRTAQQKIVILTIAHSLVYSCEGKYLPNFGTFADHTTHIKIIF